MGTHNATRRLTAIHLEHGVTIKTVWSVDETQHAIAATIQEGKPFLEVPLIAGKATFPLARLVAVAPEQWSQVSE